MHRFGPFEKIGFIDPYVVNARNFREETAEAEKKLYTFLVKQRNKEIIYFPYLFG